MLRAELFLLLLFEVFILLHLAARWSLLQRTATPLSPTYTPLNDGSRLKTLFLYCCHEFVDNAAKPSSIKSLFKTAFAPNDRKNETFGSLCFIPQCHWVRV
jgi:hypothetical protein